MSTARRASAADRGEPTGHVLDGHIPLHAYGKIVVLTGAGVSVASGLRSYRGPDGVWNDGDAVKYAMVETWRADPLGVWRHFAAMRGALLRARPNEAHNALARARARVSGDAEFHLITQNVDGLHQAAGSLDVIELHGNLRRTRCSVGDCTLAPFLDETTDLDKVPACPTCGAPLRPDIILFGEILPWEAERAAKQALRECDLFIAVGTSGTVTPAASFVRSARYEGARTVLVNLEPMTPPNPYFDEEILGRARELVLPALLGG